MNCNPTSIHFRSEIGEAFFFPPLSGQHATGRKPCVQHSSVFQIGFIFPSQLVFIFNSTLLLGSASGAAPSERCGSSGGGNRRDNRLQFAALPPRAPLCHRRATNCLPLSLWLHKPSRCFNNPINFIKLG
ncbi:hypothetical protein CDAR_91961 [Caerostris darwini]|uniref:Uncharacterized protein n=1 Tax=Caerostris darwini TaxID=1538125 RepID=A0AAV4QQY0_9ARAC|nr:hypothetical protein CDAR_91961 [Caerostris darwini]